MGEITKDSAEEIFQKYLSSGGNFIDTANKYHEGQSEEWLGEWITKRGIREDLVIATKFSLPMKNSQGKYTINGAGNGRKHIFSALDESLKRLQTSYVDIAYVHFHDFTTKPQELMRTLDDLVRSGKTRFVAVSDTPAWEVSRANMLADLRGWSEFIAYQGRYHLGERDVERDVLPMCRELDMAFVPWAILGQGKFTGRSKSQGKESGRAAPKLSDRDQEIALVLEELSHETGRSAAQICINWVLQQQGVTSALLGVRTLQQLEDNLKALEFTLTPQQLHRLSTVACFELGFPHNFIGTSYKNNPWLKDAGTLWAPPN
jgi:aryl-alcohol dehydrogenase-like predicted oxidoreductase